MSLSQPCCYLYFGSFYGPVHLLCLLCGQDAQFLVLFALIFWRKSQAVAL